MKRFCRKLLRLSFPLFAVCLLAPPTNATTVVMLSDEELIVNSRFIITGKVLSTLSAWDDTHTAIWTYVEVRTNRTLKGELGAIKIILKQPGGVVGLEGMHMFGQPKFSSGQRVVLYLNTAPDGSLHVAHAFMGMFSVVEDGATGKEHVTRSIEAGEVEILSRNDNEEITDRAPLDSYIEKIEQTLEREAQRVAQIEAERASEPVFAVPSEYRRKKDEAAGYSPDFTFIGGGVRWMQADSGQPISYYVNPNQSPVAGGATTEIQRAMSAWSATGANIRLQIAGQTSNCGLVSDGANTISFADCLGQLDQPVGCSGVVAITNVAWNSQSKVINGRTFKTLVETDLVFNKGMDCFLANSANLAEVACHELGHSIGLSHSEDRSALMYAVAHGGGRDATPGSDDAAGVLAIYPASGGNPGTPVSITSLSLSDGTVNSAYRQSLRATGGTPPYIWTLTSGALPSGLTLSSGGTIEGTPARAGDYSFWVLVVDSTGGPTGQDQKRVSLRIASGGNPSLSPVITRIKIKKSKKLWVWGQNFSESSVIILNNAVLTPKSFEQDGTTGELFYKGRLNLGSQGTNILYVQNGQNRSQPAVF